MVEVTPNYDTPSRKPLSEGEQAVLPKLPNLTLTDKLGSGGFGTVYAADHHLLHSKVAVKILRHGTAADPKWAARFQKEAHALSRLVHPNIVRVFSFSFTEEQNAVLVMEYLKGNSLQRSIQKNGPFSPMKAVELMLPLCDAVQHAHDNSIVHRDLKPSNIVITEDGAPKLLDFGVAKVSINEQEQKLTATGQLMGTPSYMSPEQCWGKPASHSSDIYSLCCILYFMLTGKSVFDGSDAEIMLKHCHEAPQINDPCIPIRLKAIIQKGLAKNPEDRFASSRALETALQEADLKLSAPIKKTSIAVVAGGLLLITMIAAIAYFVDARSKSTSTGHAAKQHVGSFDEQAFDADYKKAMIIWAQSNLEGAKGVLEKWDQRGFPNTQPVHHLENSALLARILAERGDTKKAERLVKEVLELIKSKEFRAHRLKPAKRITLELAAYQACASVFMKTKNYPQSLACLNQLKAALIKLKNSEIQTATYWSSYYSELSALYNLMGDKAESTKSSRKGLQYALEHAAPPEELAAKYRSYIFAALEDSAKETDLQKTLLDLEKLAAAPGKVSNYGAFIEHISCTCDLLVRNKMEQKAIALQRKLDEHLEGVQKQLTPREQLVMLRQRIGLERISPKTDLIKPVKLPLYNQLILSEITALSKMPLPQRSNPEFKARMSEAVNSAAGLCFHTFKYDKNAALAFRKSCLQVLKRTNLLSTSQVTTFSRSFYVPNSELAGDFLWALDREIQTSNGSQHNDSSLAHADDILWIDFVKETAGYAFIEPPYEGKDLSKRADILNFRSLALQKIRGTKDATPMLLFKSMGEEARAMLESQKVIKQASLQKLQNDYWQEVLKLKRVDDEMAYPVASTVLNLAHADEILRSRQETSSFILKAVDYFEQKQFFHNKKLRLYILFTHSKAAHTMHCTDENELKKLYRRQNEILDSYEPKTEEEDTFFTHGAMCANMIITLKDPKLAVEITKKCYVKLKQANSNTSLKNRFNLLSQLAWFLQFPDNLEFDQNEFLDSLKLAKSPSDILTVDITHLVDSICKKYSQDNQQSTALKFLDQVEQEFDRNGLGLKISVDGITIKDWLENKKTAIKLEVSAKR